jgi:hypothetical protein
MATAPLVWADSFMGYSSAQAPYFYQIALNNPTISNTGGRNGRGSCQPNGTNNSQNMKWISPTGYTTWIASFAIDGPMGSNTDLFVGGQRFLGNGTGFVRSGGGGVVIPTGQWTHVSIRVFCDPSVGTVDVWLNEALALSLTGLNTGSGASSWAADGTGFHLSDLILQASNTGTDTPFGDRAVQLILPNGAGGDTGFTPLSGANYTNVDEAPSDGDTSYVYSSTPGTKDTYTLQDLPVAADAVEGIVWKSVARKTDAGTRTIAPVLRISATDYVGTTQNPSTSYSGYFQAYAQNPATSAAWTPSDVNGLEAGQEVVS